MPVKKTAKKKAAPKAALTAAASAMSKARWAKPEWKDPEARSEFHKHITGFIKKARGRKPKKKAA
jgi:hypothetical protein